MRSQKAEQDHIEALRIENVYGGDERALRKQLVVACLVLKNIHAISASEQAKVDPHTRRSMGAAHDNFQRRCECHW